MPTPANGNASEKFPLPTTAVPPPLLLLVTPCALISDLSLLASTPIASSSTAGLPPGRNRSRSRRSFAMSTALPAMVAPGSRSQEKFGSRPTFARKNCRPRSPTSGRFPMTRISSSATPVAMSAPTTCPLLTGFQVSWAASFSHRLGRTRNSPRFSDQTSSCWHRWRRNRAKPLLNGVTSFLPYGFSTAKQSIANSRLLK